METRSLLWPIHRSASRTDRHTRGRLSLFRSWRLSIPAPRHPRQSSQRWTMVFLVYLAVFLPLFQKAEEKLAKFHAAGYHLGSGDYSCHECVSCSVSPRAWFVQAYTNCPKGNTELALLWIHESASQILVLQPLSSLLLASHGQRE